MVNRSRGIFTIGQGAKDNFCNLILQSYGQKLVFADVNVDMVKQYLFHLFSHYACSVVKRSSSKNDSQALIRTYVPSSTNRGGGKENEAHCGLHSLPVYLVTILYGMTYTPGYANLQPHRCGFFFAERYSITEKPCKH